MNYGMIARLLAMVLRIVAVFLLPPLLVSVFHGETASAYAFGATMALIMLSILPVIVFYLSCQKYIIKGVAAGAVKG